MRSGDIETLTIPCNPLDVLAQQTVAAAAMDDLKPDDWYVTVRKAAPFEDLDRTMFDAVMGMMTGAYNGEDFSAFRPPLQYNEEAGLISARPGAQRLAVTSGGTIPDRGTYTVVLPEEGSGPGPRKVGELDEEMVYESRVGDVITLGTSTWQIQEITRDRVVVVPAQGVPPDCRSGMAKATGGTRHSDGPKADSYAIWRKDYARKSRTASQETRPADSTRQQSHVYVVTDWTTTPSAILPTCLPNSAPPRERFPTTVSWSSNAARMKKAIGV